MIRGMGLYTEAGLIDMPAGSPGDLTSDAGSPAALAALKARSEQTPGAFTWIGVVEPTRDELHRVGDVFGLNALHIDDALNPDQRPKLEIDEEGHGLVLLKVLDYADSTSDVTTGQIALFLGPRFVITVRIGPLGDLGGVRERLVASPNLRAFGPLAVLYAVLDKVVDGYLAVMDEVANDVENLETEVFAQNRRATTPNTIYLLKRENVEVRRAVGPLVGVGHDFVSERVEWIPDQLRPFFRDIGDHVLRVYDSVESVDTLLMTMLMAATSLQDLQQNRDMRKISAWVAIAAVPTALAAIYGMNFDYMPELHSQWGYPAVVGAMALICLTLYRAFKRSGWL